MLGRTVGIEGGDAAIDDGGHADLAAGLDRQAVQKLIALQIAEIGVGGIDHRLVRREADPVGRDDVVAHPHDLRAVGLGVIERAELAALRRRTAVIGEPEAAGLVEDDVVGSDQPAAVARVVQGGEGAGRKVDPLDHAALVGRRRGARDVHPVQLLELEGAAVVADIDRAVGPDRRAVRPAADLGDDAGLAVGRDPGERLAFDLHQHHRAVGHGDGAFRELKAFGDEFEVEVHGHCTPLSPRVSGGVRGGL